MGGRAVPGIPRLAALDSGPPEQQVAQQSTQHDHGHLRQRCRYRQDYYGSHDGDGRADPVRRQIGGHAPDRMGDDGYGHHQEPVHPAGLR